MQKVKISLVYLAIVFCVFLAFPFGIPLLPVDEMTQKALYINAILLYQPLIILVLCFIQASRKGMIWYLPVLMGFLLFPTDFIAYPHADGLDFYVIPYSLIGYVGGGLGQLLYRVRNRKK